MKTPAFWQRKNRLAYALWPLSIFYETAAFYKRLFTTSVTLPVPVICIGNITAGGSGKTPMALYVGAKLKEKNITAFYVSRGYGGYVKGPMLVNPDKHFSVEVGDEPLLLARVLPTVVGKDRLAAAQFAIKKGAKLLIFDDGFQNKTIFKKFSFLVMDGTIGIGNGFLLPAGPLRERLSQALLRTHCAVVINPLPDSPAIPEGKPTLFARTKVSPLAEKLRGQKVVAFCGIAYPDKFKRTLLDIGANILAFEAFADHQPLSHKMLMPLIETASKEQAYLVTTAKDAVRLPAFLREKVVVVDIELVFSNPELADAMIDYITGLV